MRGLGARAYAGVAAVFLLGGIVGAGAMHATDVAFVRGWLAQASGGSGGAAFVTKYLTGELKLTASQAEQLGRVMAAHEKEAQTAHRRIYPELDGIQDRMNAEIRAFLEPAQQQKFDVLVAQEKQTLRARSGYGPDGGP